MPRLPSSPPAGAKTSTITYRVPFYDTDAMLAPHLLLARRAGHDAGAAEFAPFDLRAADRVRLLATPRPV